MKVSQAGMAPALAFFVMAAAPVGAQTFVSAPVGVIGGEVSRGESGLAVSLVANDVFVGLVLANTDGALSFDAAAGAVGARLSEDGRYYVEVVTGPLEGERLDVNVPETIAAASPAVVVSLGSATFSTRAVLAPDALVGARCVVRPHLTLARLQALFQPGLAGSDLSVFADGVRLLEDGEATFYHLRADGVTWRRPGSSADHRDKVLPPDVSFLVEVKSRAQTWTQAGRVRINAFRKNLVSGFQSFASGFPVDLSPAQIGAFVSSSEPLGTRWTGHNVFVFADQIQLLFRPGRPLDLFYLRGDGSTWRSLTSTANVAHQPILGATGMVLLRRIKPDPAFAIPPPFAP